VDAYDLI